MPRILGRANPLHVAASRIALLSVVPAVVCLLLLPAARICGAEAAAASKPAAVSKSVDFQNQIAPLLSQRCLNCHNPNLSKGKLDLSSAKTALAGGDSGPAVVPGKPSDSQLIDMITPPAGGRAEMPKEGTPLTGSQVALVRRWIEEGADWPRDVRLVPPAKADLSWWSLQPLADVQPPAPPGIPAEWARNPIDRFIYAKLAARGMHPSPPADKRTLIRRATYDLIGLPPTPEEIAAFLADDSPDAYERLVDRLLASPHYGEQWGRHWLDVARYGESDGYEVNALRDNAWPYRDYVVRSLNDDKPFDRFVLEQLAGDQIAPGDPDVEAATGFLVAGPVDAVGNQDPAAAAVIRANTLDDIITATGAGLLGLTVNCCRCHDHKFDPIRQADYYGLYATFAGVHHDSRVWAPALQRREWEARHEVLVKAAVAVDHELAQQDAAVKDRVASRRDELMKRFPRPKVDKHGTEETFEPVPARFVRFDVTRLTDVDPEVNLGLDAVEVYAAAEPNSNLALASRGAKITARKTRGTAVDPTLYSPDHLIDGRTGWLWLSGEVGKGQITIELPRAETIGRVRWSNVPRGSSFWFFPEDYTIEVSLDGRHWTKVADNAGRRPYDDDRLEELLRLAVMNPAERAQREKLTARRDELARQIKAQKPLPTAWLGEFSQPKQPGYVMLGGNPQRHGDAVAPGSLSTLARVAPSYSLAADAPEGKRREALARWITDPKNPLTPRVLANRLWHYHFGRGIVGTPSDFGFNGQRPTHPELLDWLAGQVHRDGWRWKPLHRLIMTSQTYRQASRFDAAMAPQDGDAAYLWRFPPRRLTAEELRDSILSVAGKLDPRMGGPGFRLFKYERDNVSIYRPLDEPGPETFRRSIYHQNPRSAKVDVLGDFDLADCTMSVPKRDATTSPLQALAMLNNGFISDMSHALAARLEHEAGEEDRAAQIERAYLLAFGRPPDKDEGKAARDLIDRFGLAVFCRAMFNANELLYVY